MLGWALALALTAPPPAKGPLTTDQFKALMRTVSEGWIEGNARKAADCFTEDAVYSEPPRKQFYKGRAQLYEFFGGVTKPDPPMNMAWHHLVFDEATQVGAGEYTFVMNNRYHGVVMVRISDGRIANWREYQYPSTLPFEEFAGENRF